MLDLLLRHYRGAFDRIYLYPRSASLDKAWDPLRKYVEEVQGVNQDDEPTLFDEFDTQALQDQMDLQMRVAAYAKKAKHKEIPQVLFVIDDFADDERIMHSNITSSPRSLSAVDTLARVYGWRRKNSAPWPISFA